MLRRTLLWRPGHVICRTGGPCRSLASSGRLWSPNQPKHWEEDLDREPSRSGFDESKDSLKVWIRAVLSPRRVSRTPEQEKLREFWQDRVWSYQDQANGKVGTDWSLSLMVRSIFSRPFPVKATALHFTYSSAITASYMSPRSAPESMPWLIEEAAAVVHYIMDIHGVLALESCTAFLATALFMCMSFRLDRAAMRWWTGRRLCGDLLRDARCLNQTVQLAVSNQAVAVELGLLSYGFARATEFHIRQEPEAKFLEAFRPLLPARELEALMAAPHRPLFLAERLTGRLSDAYDAGHVKNVRLVVSCQDAVDRLVGTVECLERIRGTPEPWSYQSYMKLLTQVWLVLLPLALVPKLQWATPVLGLSIAYLVYKLNDIAVEISSPFGYDKSDLGICLLNDRLQREHLASLLRFVDWDPKPSVVMPEINRPC